jgi:spermidine/putrescine transport system substrate-binding protein
MGTTPTGPRPTPRVPLEPEVARLLTSGTISRRSLIRGAAAGGGLLLGSSLLAACGIRGGTDPASTGGPGGNGGSDRLVFANWPYYLDFDDDASTSETLQQFRDEFGIEVEYLEEINSNDEWFARFRNQLAGGQDIGRDITTLTDWMAARMIGLGWIDEIDADNVPNRANLLPALQQVAFDPGRRYSLTWQSGFTGIGYNPRLTGRPLTSINDLFDEEFRGRVTFLAEMRDTTGLVMAGMGVDPGSHDFSDYEAAIAKLQAATDDGQIRRWPGNDYTSDLASGDVVACVAWSGDIIQLQLDDPDLEFVIPSDGGYLWSDNMMIPKNAANKANAERMMDFVYRPEVAAQIAAYVNYITPVVGAREAIEEIDPELAEDELIFPSAETLANTFEYLTLDEDEESARQELFQSLIGA